MPRRATNNETRGPTALPLVEDPAAPKLPVGERLLAPAVRRPGELHEVVALSSSASRVLARQTTTLDLDADVVASLLLEAAALEAELTEYGLASARTLLGEAAACACVTRGTRAAEADYLRALTSARHGRVPAPVASVALPVRLLVHLERGSLDDLLATVALERAVAYEIAALTAGRTMSEWGLGEALAASAGSR